MKHLLGNWDELKELFVEPIFFISDYDGTLAPIVDRPSDAELSPEIRKSLGRLVDFCPVGIVSGRELDDLKSQVGVKNVYYSGNHGYEISGPDIEFVKEGAKKAAPAISQIVEGVRERTKSMEGVLIEDKTYTASIHFRLVKDEDLSKLKKIFNQEIESYRSKGVVEVNCGKKVFEIRPSGEWNKGKAVSLLRQITGFEEETLPVYLGDDITDEDAFFTLNQEGLGILVSDQERETAADFRLNDVDEVKVFLENLIGFLEEI